MLLYYITDRRQLPGGPREQRSRLLDKIAEAAHAGVDYIQLREKDLPASELESLARDASHRVANTGTKLLINSRSDVAIATGASGVHLTSTDIPAGDARCFWSPRAAIIGVSCHSLADVRMAESQGADFAVLAPIFGKGSAPGIGLKVLAEACCRLVSPEHTESAPRPTRFPVLALGGVTLQNVAACRTAEAAGVAGIRLFQENEIAAVVKQLR